jgi:2-keto-4-pentenoate hydratase
MSSTDASGMHAANVSRIVERFVHARLHARALQDYPGTVPATLEEAYRCQEVAIERWPERIAGWKVARVPATFKEQYPEERLIGPAFANNIQNAVPGKAVDRPIFDGGFAAVEAELVIRVGADPPQKRDWTIDEAAAYVGSLHIGVEVASSPLATLNDLGPGAVISDFGNNWGVIVGPQIDDWRSIEELAVQSFIDGELVGQGTAFTRQGALGALAFTLMKCAERGRRLHAGEVISTGMITGVHDIRIGQTSRHVFDKCGEVECRAIKAQPHPTVR